MTSVDQWSGVRPGYYESVGGTISGLSISGFILVSNTDQALTDRVIVERMDELHSWVGTVSGCGGARVQY